MSETTAPNSPHDRSRQALRAFQQRLADRLQAAQSTGVAASWLAVESGGRALLFPLNHAGEIFPWTATRHVPYAQPWFLGVANLRGGLLGVVDLAAFLAASSAASPASSAAAGAASTVNRTDNDWAQCRLVAFNPVLEAGGALLIDRLLGLRTPDAFTRSDAPPAGAPSYHGHVYTDAQGRPWQEINLQRLALDPAFLRIGV